jgi:hypothetical protein
MSTCERFFFWVHGRDDNLCLLDPNTTLHLNELWIFRFVVVRLFRSESFVFIWVERKRELMVFEIYMGGRVEIRVLRIAGWVDDALFLSAARVSSCGCPCVV